MTPAPTAPVHREPNPLIEWCKQEANAKAPLCRNVGQRGYNDDAKRSRRLTSADVARSHARRVRARAGAQGTVLIAAVKDVSWSDMARTLPDSVCIATRAKRMYWSDD